MKYIMLMILLGYGEGGIQSSNVPTTAQIKFNDEAACNKAKEILINDLQNAGLIIERRRNEINAWKKSDEVQGTRRNYSITCLPE